MGGGTPEEGPKIPSPWLMHREPRQGGSRKGGVFRSEPNMTGRPEYWTTEMNGGSSLPYLACAPCVPLFVHCLIRVEAEGLLDCQGRAGIISIVRWNLRPVISGVDFRGQKRCREKTPRISNFRPKFCSEKCSEFSPNVFENFSRALFLGKRRPLKFHQNSPPFSFQCQIPKQLQRKTSQKFSGEQAK